MDRAEVGLSSASLTLPAGSASWLSGTNGIACTGGAVTSVGPATALNQEMGIAGRMSFEAWIEPADPTSTNWGTIAQVGSAQYDFDFAIHQVSSSNVLARVRTNNAASENYVPYNQGNQTRSGSLAPGLTHLMVTYDGAFIRVYFDGVLSRESGLRGWLTDWNDVLSLCANGDGSEPWQGNLRMVAFYNRALTAGEVADNFAAGPDVVTP